MRLTFDPKAEYARNLGFPHWFACGSASSLAKDSKSTLFLMYPWLTAYRILTVYSLCAHGEIL